MTYDDTEDTEPEEVMSNMNQNDNDKSCFGKYDLNDPICPQCDVAVECYHNTFKERDN